MLPGEHPQGCPASSHEPAPSQTVHKDDTLTAGRHGLLAFGAKLSLCNVKAQLRAPCWLVLP